MNNLHIIEDNNLYGLADANNREIVECIYDQIKPLKSGNFMVITNNIIYNFKYFGTFFIFSSVFTCFYSLSYV